MHFIIWKVGAIWYIGTFIVRSIIYKRTHTESENWYFERFNCCHHCDKIHYVPKLALTSAPEKCNPNDDASYFLKVRMEAKWKKLIENVPIIVLYIVHWHQLIWVDFFLAFFFLLFFILEIFRPNLAMFRTYFWLSAQGSLLVVLGKTQEVKS